MIAETAASTFSIMASILSVAASTKQLMTDGELSRDDALKAFVRKAGKKDKNLLQDKKIVSSILELTVIPLPLLEQLASEAWDCLKSHIDDRKKAQSSGSQIDKDLADERAAQCMCSVLRAIMKFNGKSLPSRGYFNDWWIVYNCKA